MSNVSICHCDDDGPLHSIGRVTHRYGPTGMPGHETSDNIVRTHTHTHTHEDQEIRKKKKKKTLSFT